MYLTAPASGTASATHFLSSINAACTFRMLNDFGIWVNSCGVPVAKKCPLLRTKTSLQCSASSKYAVLTSTLIPSVHTSDSKISHNSRLENGSTPTVGSSSNKSSGERTNVQARLSFCFIPPDNLPA